MFFKILASGSKGNATLIYNNNTLILIDMGVSLTTLKNGLKFIDKTLEDIDACLFTHDHSDHISGIRFLKNLKTYALENTIPTIHNSVNLYETFYINTFEITPVKTYHDAKDSCGYIIYDLINDQKLVYITDTGFIDEKTIRLCKDPTYLILESNHDLSMLMNSTRPEILKRRIRGQLGHLNNEDSAFYACDMLGKHTKEIVLAHISEECNSTDEAFKAYRKVFSYRHKNIDDYKIIIAKQYECVSGGHYDN